MALRLLIDNWRWADVPFYMRTGKHMTGRRTECVVHFRQAPYALFRDTPVDKLARNALTLGIQPVEGLTLTISAKHPGPTMQLSPVELAFKYTDVFKQEPNVGYETLLYDCLIGDGTLFQRFFFEKKKQKTFAPLRAHPGKHSSKSIKVFWFFSSAKPTLSTATTPSSSRKRGQDSATAR